MTQMVIQEVSSHSHGSVSQKRPRSQAIVAAIFLTVGVLGGGLLVKSALASPVPGSAPSGTPLANPDSVSLVTNLNATPIDGPATLVLYEGPDEEAELMALSVVNLAGHFGPVTAKSVFDYEAGEMSAYEAVAFVGVFGEGQLPRSFLLDIASTDMPILWLGSSIDQLRRIDDDYFVKAGWIPSGQATLNPVRVSYKDIDFERSVEASSTRSIRVLQPKAVDVLATANEQGEAEKPWAIRASNLTYIAEVPFDYLVEANHSLIVADLLFDLLDPTRPERHRAMVRLEDVGPYADPASLRRIADELSARDIPFSVSVYTIWRDPDSQYQWGDKIRLADRPETVAALRYIESKGGTLLMHGITHQYGDKPNPYHGTSGEDFEFARAHVDENNDVIVDGPVPDDSPEWVRDRIRQGFAEMADAGLQAPTIFEFPHYTGSPVSYQAIAPLFEARYEQGTYFPGLLSGREINPLAPQTQFVPYPIFDAYGEYVVPENLGNIIPVGQNNHHNRFPADLVTAAERTLVVRDGIASFFFHPYLDIDYLLETVDGMTDLGYEFVSPQAVLDEWR